MTTCDAIIIGAGPAGSTAALLLARAGWRVSIVEKSEFPRSKVCGEFISATALSLLARYGIAARVLAPAGPEIREIAVYAGETMALAAMPAAEGVFAYGRALARDRLDDLLLDAAVRAGAMLYQPWRVQQCERFGHRYVCRMVSKPARQRELRAHVVIAAHGSSDTGSLMPHRRAERARGSELLAFKARFTGGALPPGRMPLVAFDGGYGGLVQSDNGRVSFSCCIRREALDRCRADSRGATAGAAVLAHVLRSCRGVREAIGGAVQEERWLSAAPIRPGVRRVCGDGYFAVGNAVGEAHPIVAEGISMAIQSACLLCELLMVSRYPATSAEWKCIAGDYERAYRSRFALRIRAASLFAMLAMRPRISATAAEVLAAAPQLLELGARWAGKAQPLRV